MPFTLLPNLIPHAQTLDDDLAAAAASFVTSEVTPIEPAATSVNEKVVVKLSMLFKWYGGDFSDTDQGLLEALAAFAPSTSETGSGIRAALNPPGGFELDFEPYDWSLNESE